jgi:hypothetical protein
MEKQFIEQLIKFAWLINIHVVVIDWGLNRIQGVPNKVPSIEITLLVNLRLLHIWKFK